MRIGWSAGEYEAEINTVMESSAQAASSNGLT
jgi:hypothetical protein